MRRQNWENDDTTFPPDTRYQHVRMRGVAWSIYGWETEPNEDTEWFGIENRTGRVIAVMVGDDRRESCDLDDFEPIAREDYCGSCGQIGCAHDGLDRTNQE